MGTTTNWGLPYPAGTDLIADGNDAIEALAEALDSFTKFEKGLFVARPAPTQKGHVYYSTDIPQLDLSDGTQWINLMMIGDKFANTVGATALQTWPKVHLFAGPSPQPIPHATETAIQWNTITAATGDNMWNSSVSVTDVPIHTSGTYLFHAWPQWSNVNCSRWMSLVDTAVDATIGYQPVMAQQEWPYLGAGIETPSGSPHMSVPVRLKAGHSYQIQAYQLSGSSINITGTDPTDAEISFEQGTWASLTWIAPL